MKSVRIRSYDSRSKPSKHRYLLANSEISFKEKPTPVDFDSFIPWLCLELEVPKTITVTRTNQVEYVQYASRLLKSSSTKSSRLKSRSTKTKLSTIKSAVEDKRISESPVLATSPVDIEDTIPVTTCYDKYGRLVEIAIVGCLFPIPRKVIQAFNLCLPFHSGLNKLSIRKGGVCQNILIEIGKLLPHSNITQVCLDDSRLTQGTYSVLLDLPSQIQYLSLKRCGINDEECKNIAVKIDLKGPALKTLLLLDLTSNNINDNGAQALGEILKKNRYLLYLNLSGNNISDFGASFILRYLREFLLTYDDITQKRGRRLDYLISRKNIYEKCLEQEKLARVESETKKKVNVSSDDIYNKINVSKQRKHTKLKKSVVPSFICEKRTVEDDAEHKTKEIIGKFEDPFEERYLERKGENIYAIGNFTLTSLNLAHNRLSLLTVREILKVLKYQEETNKLALNTGLVRVVIDGNNIPAHCDELDEIEKCLKKAL